MSFKQETQQLVRQWIKLTVSTSTGIQSGKEITAKQRKKN